MIVVEFRLDHPVLRETLERVPEMRIEWEQSDAIDESRVRLLLWAQGGSFEEFEAAFQEDPTVTSPTLIAEVCDRRLYQTDLANEGLDASIYPLLVQEGGVVRESTASATGWEYRVAFPNRSSVDRFFRRCRDHDIPSEIHRLYREQDDGPVGRPPLTDEQREALAAAVECGYFDVPRKCTLGGLADRLEISDSAVSQRIRRGVKSLVEDVVPPEEERSTVTLPPD